MTTGQKWLIGGGVALTLTVLGFIFLPKAFAKGKPETDPLVPPVPPAGDGGVSDANNVNVLIPQPATTPTTSQPIKWPLKRGSRGQAVAGLQKAMSEKSYGRYLKNNNVPLPIADGVFGQQTEKALKTLFNVTSVSEAMFKRIFLGNERIITGAADAGSSAGGLT